jgi:hypothetical protein
MRVKQFLQVKEKKNLFLLKKKSDYINIVIQKMIIITQIAFYTNFGILKNF